MVKISGAEEEVKTIIDMIHETETQACTYKTADMSNNQFGVEKCYGDIDLDFMIEYEFIDKT